MPDDGGLLSEGLVVEASVVARLFRFRLLEIDASLVVSPADVRGRSAVVPPRPRRRPVGPGLIAAERALDQGAASLAASRRRA